MLFCCILSAIHASLAVKKMQISQREFSAVFLTHLHAVYALSKCKTLQRRKIRRAKCCPFAVVAKSPPCKKNAAAAEIPAKGVRVRCHCIRADGKRPKAKGHSPSARTRCHRSNCPTSAVASQVGSLTKQSMGNPKFWALVAPKPLNQST